MASWILCGHRDRLHESSQHQQTPTSFCFLVVGGWHRRRAYAYDSSFLSEYVLENISSDTSEHPSFLVLGDQNICIGPFPIQRSNKLPGNMLSTLRRWSPPNTTTRTKEKGGKGHKRFPNPQYANRRTRESLYSKPFLLMYEQPDDDKKNVKPYLINSQFTFISYTCVLSHPHVWTSWPILDQALRKLSSEMRPPVWWNQSDHGTAH